MNDIEILENLYTAHFGFSPRQVVRLKGAGSNRRYYRLFSPEGVIPSSLIGVGGDNLADCKSFVALTRDFASANVPEVLEVSADGMHYLQQDLGDISLFDIIGKEGDDFHQVRELVRESLIGLITIQLTSKDKLQNSVAYPPFSLRQILWDLNYFKYCYLKPTAIDFDEDKLQDDFEKFAETIFEKSEGMNGFMYRDFQSRNVMIFDNKPYFIDYQGGRLGPAMYDAVSFLWQARAGFSAKFRKEMLDFYISKYAAESGGSISEDALRDSVKYFVFFRTLQVLGCYGFRGLIEKKAQFVESIPGALKNLKESISELKGVIGDELLRVVDILAHDSRFKSPDNKRLRISVFSFSYKKGYPADYTGNGGGFMFDCRGMHNPGRYTEYKALTGMDKPVIDFLEERGEVQGFVDNAFRLVTPSVQTYIRRGFKSLQIGFGCTGGQHRSVYCAEHLSVLLADAFPEAEVVLQHREQGVERVVEGTRKSDKWALVLAAGLGTRLKPWTLQHPKALVPVAGVPMLQRVIETLKNQGFNKIIVNVHHFADQIREFLASNDFGVDIYISDESDRLLDTGGGILRASQFLPAGCSLLVHNVDILSDANLAELMTQHNTLGQHLTLLTSGRESSRKLMFDACGNLRGWHNLSNGAMRLAPDYNPASLDQQAFSGIYVISSEGIARLSEYAAENGVEAFPIMDFLLSFPAGLEVGRVYDGDLQLIDIGKPETLAEANMKLGNS